MIQDDDAKVISKYLSFWKHLSTKDQKYALNKIQLKSFEKGQVIYGGLDDCQGLILVKKGQLRAFILSEGGKEVTLYRLFKGDICILSASCVLRNITFDIYIQGEKEGEILTLPTDAFMKISEDNIEVQKFTNDLTLTRFSDVMWIMEQILFMSFDKRLALFLLEQSEIENSNSVKMTHEDIAKNMGSAREVVSRMLKYFQNEGYVKTERGSIVILEKKKLQEITF
jgi:CRP/FNR family transcriptional regulator